MVKEIVGTVHALGEDGWHVGAIAETQGKIEKSAIITTGERPANFRQVAGLVLNELASIFKNTVRRLLQDSTVSHKCNYIKKLLNRYIKIK